MMETTLPLVQLYHSEPVTTTLAIAEGTANTHEAVIKLVRTYTEDLQEFGPFGFQIRKGSPLPQGGFARSTEYAFLNEPQATLLLTYMRNSDIVRAFKKALVKAFFALRDSTFCDDEAVDDDAPGLPPTPGHRASHIIAATRCFSGLMRAAGTLQNRRKRTNSFPTTSSTAR